MRTKPTIDEPDRVSWDKLQRKLSASFLQSGLWAGFQETLGHRTHFLNGEGWRCLLIERKTPLGKYLFAPYGPTLAGAVDLADAVESIKRQAKRLGFDWLIIEPMLEGGSAALSDKLAKLGARRSSHMREPDLTRIINLKPPEEDILARISQSTRSLIRKNQREGTLSFKTSQEPADIDIFIKMLAAVTNRKNVHFFPDEYFHKQARLLMPAGMLRLELACQDAQPIASALIHDFNGTSAYTFAASLPPARQLSASALLLWEAMLGAKGRGSAQMDLFGIAPDDAPAGHPWQGFSSFKKKFGGEVVSFAGAWDIPLTAKYRAYRAAQSLRGWRRGH